MSDRDFEWVKAASRGNTGVTSGYRITCGKCGSNETFAQNGTTRKPPKAAEQYFRGRGWVIGARSPVDRCPKCWAAQSKPTPKPPVNLKLIENQDQQSMKAETPPEPTRDERRIIFSKLQDVYLDEVKGYDSGWTDHRVAEDLGVPRSWVATIRDENFGPAKDNLDIREFLAKLEMVEAEHQKFVGLFNQAKGVADVVKVQMDDLQRLAKDIRRQVA